MAIGDTEITLVGNLVDEPVMRFTPSGVAVTNFRVASSTRRYDRDTGQWRDGDTLFLTCSAWRHLAENIIESDLPKGGRVIVQGRLKQRSYEKKDGTRATVFEVDAAEVGPSLRNASAKPTKAQRQRAQGFGGSGSGGAQDGAYSTGGAGADDPWASVAPHSTAGGFNGPSDDLPF